MPAAVVRGDQPRERRLVVGRVVEILVGKGDGMDIRRADIPHEAEQRSRIDPGGQEDADRNVGDEMVADAVTQRRAHALCRIGGRSGLPLRCGKDLGDREIVRVRGRSTAVDPQRRARWKRADVLIDRVRFGDAAEQQEAGPSGRLRVGRRTTAGDDRLDLRREAQRPAVVGIVQRLDAVRIARQQQAALVDIPQREREHAAQVFWHVRAILFICVRDGFGVAVGVEAMTF